MHHCTTAQWEWHTRRHNRSVGVSFIIAQAFISFQGTFRGVYALCATFGEVSHTLVPSFRSPREAPKHNIATIQNKSTRKPSLQSRQHNTRSANPTCPTNGICLVLHE